MIFEVVCNITGILLCLWWFMTRNFNFWKNLNVKGPKPIPIFGNYKENILGQIHKAELAKKFYDEFVDERMVGLFVHNTPYLMLRDPILIKDVFIKDFSVFSERGIDVFDKVEPLSQHMFNLSEPTWRPIRSKLTPAFSPSKLKDMFETMLVVADSLVKFAEVELQKTETLEILGLVERYSTEVLGQCGLALQLNELSEESSEFRRINKLKRQSNWYNYSRRLLREYAPNIFNRCLYFFNPTMTDFFLSMISRVAEYRQSQQLQKNDFIGILIDLKNNPHKISNIELSDNLLAAQIYVYLVAGSDSVSIAIANALYELAINPLIYEKLYEEIKDHQLSYDDIQEMKYLDCVFQETLRKYPLRNIIRRSTKSYTFSGTNVTIPPNTHIIIPLYAIHRDNQYYPEADTFNPERFDEKPNTLTYFPFGSGPRYCIGAQMATYISKIIIAKIIQNFKIEICGDVYRRNKNDPKKVFLSPKGGIHLRFKKY